MGLFNRNQVSISLEQQVELQERFKNAFIIELTSYWAKNGTFKASLESLTPSGRENSGTLITLADLCRIHLERLIGKVREDTSQEWKWQNRQMLDLAKKLSEEDIFKLTTLYRDLYSHKFPELSLVPKEFMAKFEANPSDPSLSFEVRLYENILFEAEFLRNVHLGQNSIFSVETKRLFKAKEDARQSELTMDFIRKTLLQEDL